MRSTISPKGRIERLYGASASLTAIVTALATTPAIASAAQPYQAVYAVAHAVPTTVKLQTSAPAGFENLSQDVDTLFDVSVLGRRIGSFRAVLSGDRLQFADPLAVAAAMDGVIRSEAVVSMLSAPLALNEQYRCFSGQTVGCGLLPPGLTGAIVDPQTFSVELFFGPEDAVIEQSPPLALGRSSSAGPTLVQNIGVSFASADLFSGELEYGGSLDTFASVGQTAFVAQTLLSSGSGNRLNQAHVQHIWSDRIARAGLIEDFSTTLLTNYRMVGGQYASFTSPFAVDDQLSASPLDIVLPRDADVEIRRNGVLLSVKRYAAGPQRLDTSMLPDGSYPVSVLARSDGVVVIDEVRSFSKAGGLPPPGKTQFSFSAGYFVQDQRLGSLGEDDPFLPEMETGSPIVSARAARRIGPTTGAEINLLAVDGETYGEASLRSIFSRIEGVASAAAGTDGSYGVGLTANIAWNAVRFSVGARSTKTDAPLVGLPQLSDRPYRAFFRSEDSFLASAQFLVAGGSLNLSGSYSSVEGFEDRYSAGARYNRPVEIFSRRALLNIYAQETDQDTRVGFTLTFGFGVGQNTTGTATAGLEHVGGASSSVRQGLSPVASLSASRRDQWRALDITSQAGVSTSADNDRAYASVIGASPVGAFDITAQHVRTGAGDFSTVYGNAQSGFAIGGGATKWGIARPGEAVIITEIGSESIDVGGSPDAGYRVRIDNQPADLLRPGARSGVGVPAYAEYEVTLVPENAPPYDADLSIRRVTVYPGNVVRLKFDAEREFTLFGQLVDPSGAPMANVMMRTGNDLTTTDQFGYFTLTALVGAQIEVRPSATSACAPIAVSTLVDETASQPFQRIGKLQCQALD